MATDSPNPVLSVLGRVLQGLLTRALELDPATAQSLAALEGRRIELSWTPAELGLCLTVQGGRIVVGPREGAADLSLAGNLTGFARLVLPDWASALPSGKVQMSGDADLARTIGRLAEDFEPDLEPTLARWLGDRGAAIAATTQTELLAWLRASAARFAEDAADFLREESRDLLSPAEASAFYAEVDRLRDDVERIFVRIETLRRRLEVL